MRTEEEKAHLLHNRKENEKLEREIIEPSGTSLCAGECAELRRVNNIADLPVTMPVS